MVLLDRNFYWDAVGYDQTCSLFDSLGGRAEINFGQQRRNKSNFFRELVQEVAQT